MCTPACVLMLERIEFGYCKTLSDDMDFHLTEIESLPDDTDVFQIEDGSIFYHKYSIPERLYVKWCGETVTAKLPGERIGGIGAIGNALYFETQQRIYKTAFDPSKDLIVEYVRTLDNERAYPGALFSNERDGRKRVCRMSENPDREGILVDIQEEKIGGRRMSGLHMGKIIYTTTKNSDSRQPSVRRLGKNVLVINYELPPGTHYHSLHTPDSSSPFIYVSTQEYLYTLNTDTMEFLPTLYFGQGISVESIAGVHNGVITVSGKNANGQWKLFCAELPDGYKLADDSLIAAFQCDCM
ncbi:hypothetical protein PENTCL1PPCAC_7896 [Pristionchus entomophagus]|uniref:Uncharacterized protein n=1 Tax=Pristionchus entomophagus TaxID=358040 RepID=A0AAV5SQS5_9BILA|nr:hypothetical protein PENTCL1PPCAC_7896 [Pristionchus entomophagus]